MSISWHAILGVLAAAAGIATTAAGGMPHNEALVLTGAGGVLIAIERLALAIERRFGTGITVTGNATRRPPIAPPGLYPVAQPAPTAAPAASVTVTNAQVSTV